MQYWVKFLLLKILKMLSFVNVSLSPSWLLGYLCGIGGLRIFLSGC